MDSKKVIFLESEEDGTIENLTKSNKDDSQFIENNQFGEDDNDNDSDDDEKNNDNNNDNNNESNNNNDNNDNNDNNNNNKYNDNNNNNDKESTNINVNNNNDDNDSQDGGSDSDSDDSVATDDILAVDPMYVRLTKFLETTVKLEGGGTQTKNITEILSELSDTFKKFNQNFAKVEKYMENLSTK